MNNELVDMVQDESIGERDPDVLAAYADAATVVKANYVQGLSQEDFDTLANRHLTAMLARLQEVGR